MFTDTKNLANLTVNTTNAAAKQINTLSGAQDEDKFRLKKMWKPIIRLMCRKSALAKNGKRENSSSIPNNVNLNNAAQYPSSIKESLGDLDDTSYTTHKLSLAEFWQAQQQQYQTTQQQQQEQQQHQTSTQTVEFISKASIDKTPLDTCTSCAYGRNCQHTQFHQTTDTNITGSYFHSHSHPHPQAQQLQPQSQQQQNFNYYDAEDGCFVWCENSSDIDENALREWLWQNSWQFAENATMC